MTWAEDPPELAGAASRVAGWRQDTLGDERRAR